MSTTTDAAPSSGTTRTVGRRDTPRRLPRRWIVVAVLAGLLVLFSLLTMGGPPRGLLDPDSATATGGRGLATVLRERGTRVEVVRSPGSLAGARGHVLFVPDAGTLGAKETAALAAHASSAGYERVVLLTPARDLATALDLDVRPLTRSGALTADCASPWAAPEDLLFDQVTVYDAPPGAARCFPEERGAALVDVPARGDRPRTVVLGLRDAWTNALVMRGANGALALRLLGTPDGLVWYQPAHDPADPPARALRSGTGDAGRPRLPGWIVPTCVATIGTVLIFVLWQGRRFGPLVTEALPVVVPAGETTRARARMYRRSGDVDGVASILTEAARADLARHLRLPRDADPVQIARAVHRVAGGTRSVGEIDEITALLNGLPPGSGPDALTDHARRLRRLRKKVRSS